MVIRNEDYSVSETHFRKQHSASKNYIYLEVDNEITTDNVRKWRYPVLGILSEVRKVEYETIDCNQKNLVEIHFRRQQFLNLDVNSLA